MRRPVMGANMTIFILFFGLAMLEAVRQHAWLRTTFWLGIAAMFLFIDLGRKRERQRGDSA